MFELLSNLANRVMNRTGSLKASIILGYLGALALKIFLGRLGVPGVENLKILSFQSNDPGGSR